jgi:hypothetical protein
MYKDAESEMEGTKPNTTNLLDAKEESYVVKHNSFESRTTDTLFHKQS